MDGVMTRDLPTGEHPTRRPFELYIGIALAIVGALIIGTGGEYAPGYLADAEIEVTYLYAAVMVAAGVCLVTGLILLWRNWMRRTLARIVLVSGYILSALIFGTYLETLLFGRLASPRSTLLIGLLSAALFAGLTRAYHHIKDNRQTRRAQVAAQRYLDE